MKQQAILNSPYEQAAVAAAKEHGVDPALLCAIVMTESSWRPNVSNTGPGDSERGGSYGLGQVSLQTAEALGYRGAGPGLLDPETNLEFAARLCAANTKPDETPSDIICRYNSGKPMARANAFTTGVYLPRVLGYLSQYRVHLNPV